MSAAKVKMICALSVVMLLFTMLCPALAESVKAQVSSSSAHVYQSPSASSKNIAVKKGLTVTVTAVKGGWARVTRGGKTGYMMVSELEKVKKSTWKDKVIRMDWFHAGQYVLRDGGVGALYDIQTGTKIRIKRMGGHYHFDVEPYTKNDAKKLKALGAYSWACRPAILYSDGYFVACSFNTMPHGDQTIYDNGYEGQFCIHLLNSLTHGTQRLNQHAQDAMREAYYWAHPDA